MDKPNYNYGDFYWICLFFDFKRFNRNGKRALIKNKEERTKNISIISCVFGMSVLTWLFVFFVVKADMESFMKTNEEYGFVNSKNIEQEISKRADYTDLTVEKYSGEKANFTAVDSEGNPVSGFLQKDSTNKTITVFVEVDNGFKEINLTH